MKSHHLVRGWLSTLVALVFCSPLAQCRRADPLKPFTTCRFSDGLEVVQVDRLPEGVTSRVITT
jgi:hypothetical protein